MFTTRPQDVEVYQAGGWWPGSLLGWRHDSAGDCHIWVRVVIGGVEETAWTDLSTLRLPERSSERHLAMAPSLSATEQLKVAAGRMPAPGPSHAAATRCLPPVRATAASSVPVQRSGGRRAAEPATAEFSLSEAPAAAPVPGRHRAAGAAAGLVPARHRAADTGMMPVAPDDATGRLSGPATADLLGSAIPPGVGKRCADRSGAPAGMSAGPWVIRPPVADQSAPGGRRRAVVGAEPDLLTRPMRLDDLASKSGKPRLDGLLNKA